MESSVSNKNEELYWAKHKPNALITVIPDEENDFFKCWCRVLTAFIKLTPREIDVTASFLKQRYELEKVIHDPAILDSTLMGNEVRERIIKECGITLSNFYVVTGTLKKKKVITDAGINPRLIPRFRDDKQSFQLLLSFKDIHLS